MVTRRGEEAVVILAADEYRRLSGQTPRLMDCLLDAQVLQWVRTRKPLALCISAMTWGELQRGVTRLPESKRPNSLYGCSSQGGCCSWR